MIKVLIVDDDAGIRYAWSRFVAQQEDMQFVGALDTADSLVAAVTAHLPDVVLLDLNTPGVDGIDALRHACAARPETRIIVFSGWSDPERVQRAIDAGARGYLDKLVNPLTVLDAVRRVARGEVLILYRG